MTEVFKEKIIEIAGADAVCEREPMAKHTTFGIGGPADLLVAVHSGEILAEAVRLCVQEEVPWMIIGNGSNLLVGDGGIPGVVFQIFHAMDDVVVEGVTIMAGAGVLLSRLAAAAAREGLTGLEWAGGIPGTLGGGIVMNAGAYGGELSQVIDAVTVLTPDGEEKTYVRGQCGFGYRISRFQKEGSIVLRAQMTLQADDKEEILRRMQDFGAARRRKQPLEFPSAGSTFKRPEGYFAGKLIEEAGLKGRSIGGAMVSPRHAGFIINTGKATAADVLSLIRYVQETVYRQTGVRLEPEVRLVGEFADAGRSSQDVD